MLSTEELSKKFLRSINIDPSVATLRLPGGELPLANLLQSFVGYMEAHKNDKADEPLKVEGPAVFSLTYSGNRFQCPKCGEYEIKQGEQFHDDCGAVLLWDK